VILRRATPGLAAAVALLLATGPAWGQGADQDSVPPPPTAPVLPIPPLEVHPGPLSPGSRLVFTRDSIVWLDGYTLADLLMEVPGTYAARTGFAGQPTPVYYAGRGAAGIEIFYDGQPITSLGADSVGVDPGRISLIGLRHVEVERHPGFLRVYLVSERHELPGARTLLRIVNGDFRTAGYAGLFQYRWTNGIGVDLSADYFNSKGGQGETRNATWFDLRAAADWTPSPLVSAAFQLRSLTFDRAATAGPAGLDIPLRDDTRRETLFRLVASTRPHRQGLSFEAGLQSTVWRADSATADTVLGERSASAGFVGLRVSGTHATADLQARVSDYHTTAETRLGAGWMPLGWLTVSGGARWAAHRGGRTSRGADASLALHGGPFSLVGDVRWSDAVASPVLADDTAQTALDLGARAGFASRRVTLHAGVEQRDAFQAPPLAEIRGWPLFPPAPEATFFVGDATLNLGSLALSGWYADPVSGEASAFDPPSHSRAALTFRSTFLRTFRSGAFDLKVQIAVEAWGAGSAGLDASGAPLLLPGTSVAEAFLQVELVSFHAFYSLRNALRSREGYVPGFEYPRNRQTFGVKWLFRD
jgi:hypothetical protein